MKLGPKYKICKRLGSSIFEKCQTRQFALSKERTSARKKGRRGSTSDYSRQLLEKQKLRLQYGLTERQFSNYVKKALEGHTNPQQSLFELLETRLDSVAYRMGLAPTRRAARQMVSHGHLTVNGRRVTIPSYRLYAGDVVKIRDGSRESGLFSTLADTLKEFRQPGWVTFDLDQSEGTLSRAPSVTEQDTLADIGAVFEYYTR